MTKEGNIKNLTGYSGAMDLSSQHFQPDVSLKILITFGDVILHCILLAMAFQATTSLALQLSKDTLSCVAVNCLSNDSETNKTCELLKNPQLTEFLNSECLHSYETFFMFFEAASLLFVYNLCLVFNPRCSQTLQQFVKVVTECYESIGTPEQISKVLKSPDESPADTEHSPDNNGNENDVENDFKRKVKTIYHKVRRFGDLQIDKTYMRWMYFIRAYSLVILSIVFALTNFILSLSFTSPFKCNINNDVSPALPIAYDDIVCSRHMAFYFKFTSFIFIFLLLAAGLATFYSQFYIPFMRLKIQRKFQIEVHKCCGHGDLAFLCHLLKNYSYPEYERFILFYSKGEVLSCPESPRESTRHSYLSFV